MQATVKLPLLLRPPHAVSTAPPVIADGPYFAIHQLGLLAGSQLSLVSRIFLAAGQRPDALVTHEGHDGGRTVVQVMGVNPAAALDAQRAKLGQQEGGVRASVLSHEGSLDLGGIQSCALILEARWFDPSAHALVAVPYRAAATPGGFALHQPRLLEFSHGGAALAVIEAAFFAGIDSFKPAGLWAEYFSDENDAKNVALRMGSRADARAARAGQARSSGDARGTASETDDPYAGMGIDAIDIARLVAQLPAHERSYPMLEIPPWAEGDPLSGLFDAVPELLHSGRVVWGQVIQINNLMLVGGRDGAPGEIVYDPSGQTSTDDLLEVARALMKMRGNIASLRAANPPEPEALAIAEHLENEYTRAVGMPVPRGLSRHSLLLSTVYFDRRHIPGGILRSGMVPILASEKCPGRVMVLPSRWWPGDLLEVWKSTPPGHGAGAGNAGDRTTRFIVRASMIFTLGATVKLTVGPDGLSWIMVMLSSILVTALTFLNRRKT
ncbi:MAG: hypothetical protein KF778_17575 [Rhodocyclaceae bacterium]|nr:hypothetical protein [Rhodocyclaceae bacterium]MBX3670214.1 hypothetical protein [Rhodocyclaceae bacterium]